MSNKICIKTDNLTVKQSIEKLLEYITNRDIVNISRIIDELSLDDLNTKIDYIDNSGYYCGGLDRNNMTILHELSSLSSLTVIKKLINKGMDPNLEYTKTCNLNHLKAMYYMDEVSKLERKHSCTKYTCLDIALNHLDNPPICSVEYYSHICDICEYLISIGTKHTRKMKRVHDRFPQLELIEYKCKCNCTCGSREKEKENYENEIKKLNKKIEETNKTIKSKDELIKNIQIQINNNN